MEVTVNNNSKKYFKPISLTIVIESEEELCNLWHRLNINSNIINEETVALKYKADDISDEPLYNVLDEYLEDSNLKRAF